MDNYKKAIDIMNSTRNATTGDIIKAKGVTVVIDKIYYQDFYKSDRNDGTCDWDIEFVDTEGNYRHWKQYFDGGEIILI